ncbi:hypothetical protein [Brachybacterium sp. GU-2]|uniref:hypothetical protein n=1 Tax=Brachybacterium sp. GU-2 TaxID=3069708 RepID=UPI00280C2027|nr:hypothetical protein [Brachybacterium sp. GU-2]WME24442.1 hypothetical protein RBL05_07010 [Brachybacterium sp. GU-2]
MRTKAEKGRARHRDIVTRYERNEPACPSAHRAPDALVVLVHPEPVPVRFREVEQERVHDRETLLGACRRVFDLQARAWAYTSRHRDDLIQDSCVIAMSKIVPAEAACPGAEALIPEGLVYNIVRGAMRHRSEGDGRYMATESGQGREILMATWEDHVKTGGVESMRRFEEMADQVRSAFPIGRRPTRGYHLGRLEQAHEYIREIAERQARRVEDPDPTATAALRGRDPETCPIDLTTAIARLTETRAANGQSVGQLVTFAYRLPTPRGQAAIEHARHVATFILQHFGDHLDAHGAAALWRGRGRSPLEAVFAIRTIEDRDLVLTVLERLDPDQADTFLRSVLEDLAAGIAYRRRGAVAA